MSEAQAVKRGRPKGTGKPKEFAANVSEVITLRFTPEQRVYLEGLAAAGKTLPAYLRWLIEELRVTGGSF